MECVEPTLLPGICIPCIAAIQQCADNIGNVDRHICLHRQLVHTRAVRRARVEAAFPILLSTSAPREVVSDGGAEVGELADSIEFVVVNANDRRCLCVLSQDISLLQTMVSPKSLQACEKQSINDWSSSWVWVATAASSANCMSLMRSLRTFVLAMRRAKLKSLSSERVRK